MKNNKKLLTLLPLFTLVGCGYSKGYIVLGDKYASPIFAENFYREFDESLNNAEQGLNLEVDNFITSFNDIAKMDYDLLDKEISVDEYGELYKMNNLDNMFNYGVQSKLFDGQMVCGAQNGHPERAYQLARVQIDSNGFNIRFAKESSELDYFALQFKATTDNTKECYLVGENELKQQSDRDMFHNSTVTLKTHLYTKEEDNIIKNTFTSTIVFDNNTTNNGSYYKFYAFSFDMLKDNQGNPVNLSRVIGVGVDYEVDDELVNWNKQKGIDIDYSLMLYELFLPHTSWK